MTSNPSSKTQSEPLLDAVKACLTSTKYVDDDLGTVTVNVVDALMAIACAMTRFADIYEKSSAMMLQHSEVIAQIKAMMETQEDGPGHA